MAISVMAGAFNLVYWFGHGNHSVNPLSFIPALIIIATLWWRDVIREAKGGYHTVTVQKGITIGFLLFLLSEIMLFFSFFWAYFNSALAPNVEVGCQWPPVGIEAINPWSLPLVGTCL
jgi:cytochrome c oxidase subunit 3